MRTLGNQGNKVIAGTLPSFLFALIHIVDLLFGSVDMFLVLISETIVGILFSLIALQTGDIWSGVLVHSFWDTFIGGGILFIGTPEFLAQ